MGGRRLSDRELDVLALVSGGHPDREIVQILNISPETVRSHHRRIRDCLGARTRAHAVVLAIRSGQLRLYEVTCVQANVNARILAGLVGCSARITFVDGCVVVAFIVAVDHDGVDVVVFSASNSKRRYRFRDVVGVERLVGRDAAGRAVNCRK